MSLCVLVADGARFLDIITGRGWHSRSGSRIKPAIIDLLTQNKIRYVNKTYWSSTFFKNVGEKKEILPCNFDNRTIFWASEKSILLKQKYPVSEFLSRTFRARLYWASSANMCVGNEKNWNRGILLCDSGSVLKMITRSETSTNQSGSAMKRSGSAAQSGSEMNQSGSLRTYLKISSFTRQQMQSLKMSFNPRHIFLQRSFSCSSFAIVLSSRMSEIEKSLMTVLRFDQKFVISWDTSHCMLSTLHAYHFFFD